MKAAILLVEDDDEAREVIADILGDEGYEIVCAADGAAGLARAGETPNLRLVLLDLFMPVMNGWEFFAAFRADPRFASVPVVITTSAPERAPAAATCVLTKPVAIARLLSVAADLCRTG